ncbi:sigma-70 family RNA polymerase sigma factor [Sporosarcina jiandibaonis]|uniref:sigma-70 family RNA polymerase sigma factor n=1 Tax=Sporosarcina jiandibaonis TaxID=2715535 RepID=UPI0015556546|nr:sigma-70 family RNA polymerase sigma factor [Sporosarcina jiandibaonis]
MIIIADVELFNQLKTGDREALKKWMAIHSKKIEQFAVQYGCGSTQLQQVTKATFRKLNSQLTEAEDVNQLRLFMYKITLTIIRNMELPHDKENFLPFEEDQQLHEKIINLNDENKITLILSCFHVMTEKEIAFITGFPENEIMNLIAESRQKLNRNLLQIEKQLKFLGKSYERLRFSFDYENIFEEQQVESEPIQKPKSSKKILLSWIAGIVTLLTLITVSVVTGEEYQKSSTEKYIERLKMSFEKEIENKFNELGFPETIEQNDNDFRSRYAEAPRRDFDAMIRRYERLMINNEKVDKKQMKKEYKEIIEQLQLPSEMAEQLIKNPITNNKRKSEEFINLYLEKHFYIQESFYTIYYDHHEIIEDAMVGDEIDIEEFMERKDTFPEDFQRILTGLEKQNYYPVSIPNVAPFHPKYQKNELSKKIRNALHEDVGGYMTMLETEHMFNVQSLDFSLDQSLDYLIDMEKTLLATEQSYMYYWMLSHTYSTLFNLLVIDDDEDETNEILDDSGKVKEKYRAIWEKIANLGGDSPAAFIMKEIVEEMKASDWEKSKSYQRLDQNHIYRALTFAQENSLNLFTLGEFVGYGTITTSVQDPDYQVALKELYDNFSYDYNLVTLEQANPLDIIGVYYYANELEDSETMWHLLNHEFVPVNLQEYMKNWKKKESLPEQVESIFVDMGDGSINGSPLVPVGYEQEGSIYYFAKMIFDIENNIWTIYEIE